MGLIRKRRSGLIRSIRDTILFKFQPSPLMSGSNVAFKLAHRRALRWMLDIKRRKRQHAGRNGIKWSLVNFGRALHQTLLLWWNVMRSWECSRHGESQMDTILSPGVSVTNKTWIRIGNLNYSPLLQPQQITSTWNSVFISLHCNWLPLGPTRPNLLVLEFLPVPSSWLFLYLELSLVVTRSISATRTVALFKSGASVPTIGPQRKHTLHKLLLLTCASTDLLQRNFHIGCPGKAPQTYGFWKMSQHVGYETWRNW